jgi:hypothetical protein
VNLLCLLAVLFPMVESPPLTLTWRPPDGGPEVSGYYIYQREAGQQWPTRHDAGPNLTLVIVDLTPGVTYQFEATAYNQHGLESEPSNTFEWTAIGQARPVREIRLIP